jgi:putative NADH-flavin reductase
MRLLVIGASRGIGLETVRQGLARDLVIRALARSADRIGIEHPRLEPFAADATDPEAVAPALDGVDAVIHAIGAPRGLGTRLAPVTIFSESTSALIAAMHRAGIRRLVAVTGFGAGDSRARLSLPERIPHRLLLGRAYDDKDRQEVLIRGSGLDWLIVRPTILTNGRRTGRYRVLVEPGSWRNGLISRADVADFLLREAAEPTLSHATPALAY